MIDPSPRQRRDPTEISEAVGGGETAPAGGQPPARGSDRHDFVPDDQFREVSWQ